ncbi:hypothetical protein C5F59_001705 [Streptomyces sp. QL37]|uniref:hypothetical protein n=1 Tax=Streptomyces sp. QL37 TaxID=2093747 RepID=UPI000CF260B1|nr:hypothetical protein [Streptomyces sp. QL37]PPQ55549.1 hypothetical protein C5F59_01695 [Streptomyces sp. QL37]
MTEDARADVFHWEMFRYDGPERGDRSSGIVVTLAHVLSVGAVCVAEPVAGLILGGVFGLFWGSLLLPPWIRDRRSLVAVDIVPGPPALVVLRRRNGARTTRPLDDVTDLRPLTVGYRSVDSGGSKVLELRAGRTVYRTRAAFNPPANDVQLLENALRKAGPRIRVHPHEDRTSWVSDNG